MSLPTYRPSCERSVHFFSLEEVSVPSATIWLHRASGYVFEADGIVAAKLVGDDVVALDAQDVPSCIALGFRFPLELLMS